MQDHALHTPNSTGRGGAEEAAEVVRSADRVPTLRHLVGVYREEACSDLTDHEERNMELVVDLVDTIWGLDTLVPGIDRKHVDDFIDVRVEEGVTFPDRTDPSDLLRGLLHVHVFAGHRPPGGLDP